MIRFWLACFKSGEFSVLLMVDADPRLVRNGNRV
jgi:hypothetical protein